MILIDTKFMNYKCLLMRLFVVSQEHQAKVAAARAEEAELRASSAQVLPTNFICQHLQFIDLVSIKVTTRLL